jgi:N-acylneuraminate cytidylyltransferase
MRILALIPARGGSKRLPGKNSRILGGSPLIVWSIDCVKKIPAICDILVSTDDSAIAEIALKAGACVPWLRPAEYATDTASSSDVAIHALNWYEAEKGPVDGLLLLQPTSPFRSESTIRRGIQLFSQHCQKTVLGVSPVHAHPMWMFRLSGDCLIPFMGEHGLNKRSQDLQPVYSVNGSFYLIAPKTLRACNSLMGSSAIPLIVDSPQETVDIDSEWDFKMAEWIAKKNQNNE